jgi:phage shock protein PspC (stress-responsive transcriptional regulator)
MSNITFSKLMKEEEGKQTCQGVISGISKHYGYNETWCKLGFFVFTFATSKILAGLPLLAYFAMIYIMKEYDSKYDLEVNS